MPNFKRKKLFVDSAVQGDLLIRCIVNWVFCICISAMVLLSWSVLSNPGHPTISYLVELWGQYRMLLGISVVLLLIAMIDFVRISNRFCGPVTRLRNEMTRLVEGDHVRPIEFREGDYWQEFADLFNELAERVQAAENSQPGRTKLARTKPESNSAERLKETPVKDSDPVREPVEV